MASSELALVNKVEMRIALANSDAKLESILKVYLAPLILKLGSPNEAVRNKVVSICNHVNTRVKSAPISLPVESLLSQFKEPKTEDGTALRMQRSFCLMYIQMGIDRMTVEQQKAILPEVISGIFSYERPFQKRLFAIVLRILPKWTPPGRGSKEEEELREKFGFDKSNADATFLSYHFTSMMLLNLSVFGRNNESATLCCPGVPPDEFEFLTNNSKDTLSPAQMVPIKRAILRFSASVLSEYERFWPALVGSQDNVSEVADAAEDTLRKLTIDYEREDVVRRLYDLCLGSGGAPSVPPKFRTRILQLLSKSSRAANTLPQVLKVISNGIASESLKELQATVPFINWTIKMATNETLAPIAKDLLKELHSTIAESNWAVEFPSTAQERTVRGLFFQAIGLLTRRAPHIIEDDIEIIKFLFESLKIADADLRNSVHEALSSLIPVVHLIKPDKLEALKELLLDQMSLGPEFSSSKYLSLRYCIAALPFSDPVGRYICILGLEPSNNTEIITEAGRGLHPYWFRKIHRPEFNFSAGEDYQGSEYRFPEFATLLEFLLSKWPRNLSNSVDLTSVPLPIFISSFEFLRRVLLMKAWETNIANAIIDEGWTHKVDETVSLNEGARKNVVDLLSAWFTAEPALVRFLDVLFEAFATQLPGTQAAGRIWLEFVTLAPADLVASLVPRLAALESLVTSHNVETREIATHALGVISTSDAVDPEMIKNLVSQFSKSTGDASLPKAHGSIEGLSYVLSRLSLRGKLSLVPADVISSFYKTLVANLDKHALTALRDASILALSQLGAYNVLSVCSKDEIKGGSEKLLQIVKQNDNERAVIAFGNLSLSSNAEARLQAAESIYALHESKQIEFLFTSGEALSCVAAGWESVVLKRSLDIQGCVPVVGESTPIMENILDKVLELSKSTKPALKKGTSIWLLSLLQFCGHLQPVIDRLELMHYAFLGFLGERDEMIQEVASRGLSLVYERGDARLKETLVHSLMQSFTADSRNSATAGRISSDTQLFDPGVLNTGDGSVSTYKDIMSLAAEAGDETLVYKFMSLASSSAIWSTRKGAAFGLGSILSKTSLTDILGSNRRLGKNLVPKLYRYRYDPNMAVQQSMKGIWDALVVDSAGIIDSQFDDILEELLKCIGDREWRVRQASCAALQDLLDGAKPEKYSASLERIWQMSFRALDDIKESVRTQAVSLCKSLANALVRQVDAAEGAANSRVSGSLQTLLPFLLGHQGLQSQAQEVQAFALDTLLKLVQKGGYGLRPFIPTLVEELLGLLSTLEPQAVNYIALNADKYGLTRTAIDATRLASIRNSPMMDAIDRCVDLLDDATMKDLYPRLRTCIRKSVGLPSKVACGRVLVTLVVRHIDVIRPYADRFLKVVTAQLQDRNDTVASSYAAAAGYLCRVASDEAVLALVAAARQMYFDGEDERDRVVASSVVVGISKHASDKFTSLAVSILPFVYVAKQDPLKSVAEAFASVWAENTGGVGAIKLYFGEILELAAAHLDDQQWRVREAAARAVAEAADAVGNQVSQTEKLFAVLVQAAAGRSWDGKEKVVGSLLGLSIKMKGYVRLRPELLDRLLKVFVVEAKRRDPAYRVHAKKFLERFCEEFDIAVPSLE